MIWSSLMHALWRGESVKAVDRETRARSTVPNKQYKAINRIPSICWSSDDDEEITLRDYTKSESECPLLYGSSGKSFLIFVMRKPGLEVIKLFSYSTQLSITFIMLINVKMPTIVGISTFIGMINTPSVRLKARKVILF